MDLVDLFDSISECYRISFLRSQFKILLEFSPCLVCYGELVFPSIRLAIRDFHSLDFYESVITRIFTIQGTHKGMAKVAVQCSLDTVVVNETLVVRINISD